MSRARSSRLEGLGLRLTAGWGASRASRRSAYAIRGATQTRGWRRAAGGGREETATAATAASASVVRACLPTLPAGLANQRTTAAGAWSTGPMPGPACISIHYSGPMGRGSVAVAEVSEERIVNTEERGNAATIQTTKTNNANNKDKHSLTLDTAAKRQPATTVLTSCMIHDNGSGPLLGFVSSFCWAAHHAPRCPMPHALLRSSSC
jgi:hypothetical protein